MNHNFLERKIFRKLLRNCFTVFSVTKVFKVQSPRRLGKKANNYFFLFLSSWSPFKLSRSEAEELLSRAEPGAFVFSHDMTSELFLSIW